MTVSGQTISLGPAATDMVIDGTSTVALGSLIMSGFGEFGGTPAATAAGTGVGIEVFTGGAMGRGEGGL